MGFGQRGVDGREIFGVLVTATVFGLATLAVELPVSTTLMLRSIAQIAREAAWLRSGGWHLDALVDRSAAGYAARGLAAGDRVIVTRPDGSQEVIKNDNALLLRPAPRPDDNALLDKMREAGVPSAPYARSLDPSGETVLALIEADPFRAVDPPEPRVVVRVGIDLVEGRA